MYSIWLIPQLNTRETKLPEGGHITLLTGIRLPKSRTLLIGQIFLEQLEQSPLTLLHTGYLETYYNALFFENESAQKINQWHEACSQLFDIEPLTPYLPQVSFLHSPYKGPDLETLYPEGPPLQLTIEKLIIVQHFSDTPSLQCIFEAPLNAAEVQG